MSEQLSADLATTSQVTGVLLDLGTDEILQLASVDDELAAKIQEAADVLAAEGQCGNQPQDRKDGGHGLGDDFGCDSQHQHNYVPDQ